MRSVAINGFGRIGKNFLRAYLADKDAQKSFKIAVINSGPGSLEHIAHFFKYDTVLGTYHGQVTQEGNRLIIDGTIIPLIAQPNPDLVDWRTWSIDWVVEASGHFTKADQARIHLASGAAHVLITAPAHGDDITIVPGVNMHLFNSTTHRIVSLGSCTTNAFIPLVKVVQETFGIEYGMMTTTHAYTSTQALLDTNGHDMRRSRAAALNIIPTTTGAARMVDLFFPELAQRISCVSIRVPVPKVSLIDFTFWAKKPLSAPLLHAALDKAGDTDLRGILAVTRHELVSSDFAGTNYSVIVDSTLTVACGQLGKLFGWYDNEWAYSVRLKDFLVYAVQH